VTGCVDFVCEGPILELCGFGHFRATPIFSLKENVDNAEKMMPFRVHDNR